MSSENDDFRRAFGLTGNAKVDAALAGSPDMVPTAQVREIVRIAIHELMEKSGYVAPSDESILDMVLKEIPDDVPQGSRVAYLDGFREHLWERLVANFLANPEDANLIATYLVPIEALERYVAAHDAE